MCPSMQRESHGQPSLTSTMPNGRFHQWADLVQHLPPLHVKSPFVHSTHPVCWQSSDLRWQTPHRIGTLRSSSRWRLLWKTHLWKTHHSRNWTGPGIPGLYAWNQAVGVDLSRSNQYLSNSLTLFRFTSCCSAEWLPLTLSHCHQGCVSSLSCSTRFDPVNSFVFSRWVSQGGTPDNFRPTLDSASELPIAMSNKGFLLARPCVELFSCLVLGFLFGFSSWLRPRFLFLFLLCFPALCLVVFLAQFSLALSFLLCIPDGSRPSSRFPSPPGSGSDAFELFGRAPSLFRALHWMGGLFASSNSSSWQHEITKLAHLRSFTSIVNTTNIGYTWRDPVPHGGKSWTKPSSHHISSSNSHGKGPSIHKSSRCFHSSSHVGSKSGSRPSDQHSIWTWSFPEHDSGSSPLKAKGIIHHWPTTKEATKSIQPSGYRSIQGTWYFSSRSASDFLRCSYQCPQFRRLWWWWRINSGLRSRPWPSVCSSWRVYISRYHSSG